MNFFWPAALSLKTTKFENKSSNILFFDSQYQIHLGLMVSSRAKILSLLKHDLIRAFEIKLQLWASKLAQGNFENFEHMSEAKNHAKALGLNFVFDSAKYATK